MKASIQVLIGFLFSFSLVQGQTTFTVNTTDDIDDGTCNSTHCSLREAIHAANANTANLSQIFFNISGAAPHTIMLNNSLPFINGDNIIIDGTSQTGNFPMNGQIVLDGDAFSGTSLSPAFSITGDNISIFGLEMINFGLGLSLGTGDNITIGGINRGNHIHQMAGGCSSCWNGINASNLSNCIIAYNVFGATWDGTAPSGEMFYGITIDGTNIFIEHNLFAVSYSINANERGIFTGVMSGTISDNYFGIDVGQTDNLAGNDGIGIYVGADAGSPGFSIFNNTIANLNTGIVVDNSNTIIQSNFIFDNTTAITVGANDSNNLLNQNSIYCNTNSIILNLGANNNIATPTITSVLGNTISGTADPNVSIEIYGDASGCTTCGGQYIEAFASADAAGFWSTTINPCGQRFSALAIDANNNTSEFSACTASADECAGAYELNFSAIDDMCFYESQQHCTFTASPSPETINDCNAIIDPNLLNDFWFRATVPSSGTILLKVDLFSYTSPAKPVVETYRGTCGALNFIQCDSIHAFPNAIIVANEMPGTDLYFRFFDLVESSPARFPIKIYELPADPEAWVICTEGTSTGYAPNEFIIQYESDATPAEIQAVVNDLIADGASLVDECLCSPSPMQVWQANNPIDMEEKRKGARTKTKVDTVNYNFILERDACDNTFEVVIPGTGGDDGAPIILTFGGNANCTATGTISPYGTSPYAPNNPTYGIKVGVIDTGVDQLHPWIANAIWNNPDLADNENCVQGDTYGYDFFTPAPNPTDNDGHGTSVNGIIASDFPSDIDLDLINLKFFDDNKGKLFDAICSMHYAIEEEVKVLNLSWGFFHDEAPSTLVDVLELAQRRDILVVNSAGNSALDNDLLSKLPSNNDLENFITVAAIHKTPNVELAGYSNYGANNVDIGALGYVDVARPNNSRDTLFGTSLAAPLVARTGAIIRAYYPMLSAAEVRNCILNTAETHSSLSGLVATSGILDHDAALICAYNTALAKCNNGDVTITGTLQIDTTVVTDARIFSDALIANDLNVNYRAGICIELQSGFEVELGAEFLGIIEGCFGTIPVPLGVYDSEK